MYSHPAQTRKSHASVLSLPCAGASPVSGVAGIGWAGRARMHGRKQILRKRLLYCSLRLSDARRSMKLPGGGVLIMFGACRIRVGMTRNRIAEVGTRLPISEPHCRCAADSTCQAAGKLAAPTIETALRDGGPSHGRARSTEPATGSSSPHVIYGSPGPPSPCFAPGPIQQVRGSRHTLRGQPQ